MAARVGVFPPGAAPANAVAIAVPFDAPTETTGAALAPQDVSSGKNLSPQFTLAPALCTTLVMAIVTIDHLELRPQPPAQVESVSSLAIDPDLSSRMRMSGLQFAPPFPPD